MAKIDNIYYELLYRTYYNGFEYEDPNRKGVTRLQIPYYNLEYSFSEGFPMISLKQVYPKMAFGELKSFLMGQNNVQDIEKQGVTFWRKDAYNYYLKKTQDTTTDYHKFLEKMQVRELVGDFTAGDLGRIYPYQMRNWDNTLDQLQNVLERLRKEPNSTKNIVTMWNPKDHEDSALTPCHTRFSFIVENISDSKYKHGLRVQWNQDSVDLFLGLPINIMYYSMMCYIIAGYLGMKPLGIIGNLSNIHLYNNALDATVELMGRNPYETRSPIVVFDLPQEFKNLDDYLEQLDYNKTVSIHGYKHLGRLDVEMLAYNK